LSNPTTVCVGCSASDAPPKHLIALPGDQDVRWHMDCHSRAEPACQVCADQIAGVPAGTVGEDLRAHLTKGRKD
jgi:hypothetical protein